MIATSATNASPGRQADTLPPTGALIPRLSGIGSTDADPPTLATTAHDQPQAPAGRPQRTVRACTPRLSHPDAATGADPSRSARQHTSAAGSLDLIPDNLTATRAPAPRVSRIGATAATSTSRANKHETPVSPNVTSQCTTSRAPVPAMPLARAASACERIARNHAMTRQPNARDAHTHAQAQPDGVAPNMCGRIRNGCAGNAQTAPFVFVFGVH